MAFPALLAAEQVLILQLKGHPAQGQAPGGFQMHPHRTGCPSSSPFRLQQNLPLQQKGGGQAKGQAEQGQKQGEHQHIAPQPAGEEHIK